MEKINEEEILFEGTGDDASVAQSKPFEVLSSGLGFHQRIAPVERMGFAPASPQAPSQELNFALGDIAELYDPSEDELLEDPAKGLGSFDASVLESPAPAQRTSPRPNAGPGFAPSPKGSGAVFTSPDKPRVASPAAPSSKRAGFGAQGRGAYSGAHATAGADAARTHRPGRAAAARRVRNGVAMRSKEAELSNKGTSRSAAVVSPAVRSQQAELCPVSVLSIVLDAALVCSMSAGFLSVLIVFTRVNLGVLLGALQSNITAQFLAFFVVLAILKVYMLVGRSFFSCTLGEWAVGLRMGSPAVSQRWYYAFLVLWRSVLVLCGGFVLFPALAVIFKKDFLYPLTGLRLYRVPVQ